MTDSEWVRPAGGRLRAKARAIALHPKERLSRAGKQQRGMSLKYDPPKSTADVLERLGALPVSVWTYGFDHDSVRHLGPMAQDFAKAFGLGDSDKRIAMVDAGGVAMAACKELLKRVRALEARVAELEAQADRLPEH